MENQFDISISEFFKDLIEKFGYNGKYAELLTVVSGFFLFFIVLGIFFSLKRTKSFRVSSNCIWNTYIYN